MAGHFLCWSHVGSLVCLHAAGGSAGLEGQHGLTHMLGRWCCWWLGAWFFFMCPLILQSPSPHGPLSRRSRAYLVLASKRAKIRSYKGSKGLGPNIRHPHFSRILLVQASHRPAQVQEEGNKLHLLMKSLQSHCKRAFVGCCSHLRKIPNKHTHKHTHNPLYATIPPGASTASQNLNLTVLNGRKKLECPTCQFSSCLTSAPS